MHGEDPESILHLCTAEKIHKFQAELYGNILQKRERRTKKKSNRKERTNISKFLEKGGYVSIWI